MYRLSSNTTLFWKLFFPTFYITFFGILIAVAFLADPYDIPFLSNPISKIIMVSLYLLFTIFMYFTIINVKRVEADEQSIYVTNYLKTYRYLKEDILDVKVSDYFIFKVSTLIMKEKTKMGKKIRFIGDYYHEKK